MLLKSVSSVQKSSISAVSNATKSVVAVAVLLLVASVSLADEAQYGCFVDRQYLDFLDRVGEDAGYHFYIDHLSSGTMTPEAVVRNFIASPEFAMGNGFIARCYFGIFNDNSVDDYTSPGYRLPDYEGLLVYWKDVMDNVLSGAAITQATQTWRPHQACLGVSNAEKSSPPSDALSSQDLNASQHPQASLGVPQLYSGTLEEAKLTVVLGFTASPEWQTRVGALDDSQFVEFLYTNLLGRASEPEGHAYHLDNLQNGAVTREELIVQFLDSPEAIGKYTNHTYVTMSYLGLLDREAEREGFLYHMDRLESGAVDPVLFLAGFNYAPEYINRLAHYGCGWTAPLPATTTTVGLRAYHDFATIQSAIDAAVEGDEIVVHPGTYFENVRFSGKNIILRSTEPTNWDIVETTIIDAQSSGSVVIFEGLENDTCILSGFTITHGGYIDGNGALARLDHNYITDNNVGFWRGAIYQCNGLIESNVIGLNSGHGLYECRGTIHNNTVTENTDSGMTGCNGVIQNNIITNQRWGGALIDCDGLIQENYIAYNTNYNLTGSSGAIARCDGIIQNNVIAYNTPIGLTTCNAEIRNNSICYNGADSSVNEVVGGIAHCSGNIVNCIIWGNRNSTILDPGNQIYQSSTPTFSCIQNWDGGGEMNINQLQLFADPDSGDFHLRQFSPCIDAARSIGDLLVDLEGNPRPLDGDGLGAGSTGDGSDFDIGAFEFVRP